MFEQLLSMYRPGYLVTLVYMFQSTEYNFNAYINWLHRTKNFRGIMYRRSLDRTNVARLLLLVLRIGVAAHVLVAVFLVYIGLQKDVIEFVAFGLALLIVYPLVWAYLLVLPVELGRIFISKPKEAKLIAASKSIFAKHQGVTIAVAGSYGKTTMKELLLTVLGEGKRVAATPANKNVSISHARFAKNLKGNEEVLIIEFGEGEPGDVARFADITQPDIAVITGIAPAHLEAYKTLAAARDDIFSVAKVAKETFVNADSSDAVPAIQESFHTFTQHEAFGWKVSGVKLDIHGTTFILSKGKRKLNFWSGLLGRHHLGFLAFAAGLGLELGMTEEAVQRGIANAKPFEHRMQPYLLSGAWVIDDTYNGNLEGIKAGTQLLKELQANRKIYITPGLVEQGAESARIHVAVGQAIAAAAPDEVILMQNSATEHIVRGLEKAAVKGKVRTEKHPLEFYSNLTHYVAAGDLVLMQNDWTDNYA